MQPATELTRDLVRFNTVNPPGAERAGAEHLRAPRRICYFTIRSATGGRYFSV